MTTPTRLRIVTINTWKCEGAYDDRLQVLGIQLRALDADIVALQESFSTHDGTEDTARQLGEVLQMFHQTVPARRKLRCHRGHWVDSHSSMALLSKSPITLSEAIELPSSGSDGGRCAQVCAVAIEGRRVLVVNVHLSHLPEQGELRAAQLHRVLNHPLLESPHDIGLLCGDFNAALASRELAPFLRAPWNLADAFRLAGGEKKVTCVGTDGQPQDLDHVLCLPSGQPDSLQFEQARVVFNAPLPGSHTLPSDHAGVMVTLLFR